MDTRERRRRTSQDITTTPAQMASSRPAPNNSKIWTPQPSPRRGLPFASSPPQPQTSLKRPRHSPVQPSVGSVWWGSTLLSSLQARADGRPQPPPRREGKAEYLLGEMRHRGKSQTRPNAGEARQPGKSGTAGDRHPASWRPSHDAPRTAPPSFSPPPVRCAAPFTGSRPLPRRSRPAPPLRRRAADRRPASHPRRWGRRGGPPPVATRLCSPAQNRIRVFRCRQEFQF